jgi:small subunit ribosomal protein S20
MANTPQAKKRIRRNNVRAEINGARISRIRSFVKKVELAIAGGDQKVAAEALREAQPELARGVARGVLHKNTVARKMSRVSKRVAGMCFVFSAGAPGTKSERGRREIAGLFLRLRRARAGLGKECRIYRDSRAVRCKNAGNQPF